MHAAWLALVRKVGVCWIELGVRRAYLLVWEMYNIERRRCLVSPWYIGSVFEATGSMMC